MTVVTEYTDMDGYISWNGSPILKPVEFSVDWTRESTEYGIVGEWGVRNIPGLLKVSSIKVTRVLDDGSLTAAMLNNSPLTGTANTLMAASTFTSGTPFTLTSNTAGNGLVAITLSVSPITTAGQIILVGTDINGNVLTDFIQVPTTLAVGGSVYSHFPFNTVTMAVPTGGLASTGNGKLALTSVAGAVSASPGAPSLIQVVGKVYQPSLGSNNYTFTFPNCFIIKGGHLGFKGGANGKLDDPVELLPRKVADCFMSYVNQ